MPKRHISPHEAEVNSGAEIDTGNGGQANTCRLCSKWCRRARYGSWRHVPANDRLNSPSGTWNDADPPLTTLRTTT